jgi:trehalose 6-phosphate synthase
MRVNALLADKLLPLIGRRYFMDPRLPSAALRQRAAKAGVNNRIGFFLHIPFPDAGNF